MKINSLQVFIFDKKPVKNIIPYLLLAVILFSCANKKSEDAKQADAQTGSIGAGIKDLSSMKSVQILLCQNWVYKDDATDYDSSNGTLDIPYRGISFFIDSTIVKQPHENILFGRWEFNNVNKTIRIKYDNGKNEEYKIKAVGPKDLTLMEQNDDNEKLVLVADGKQEADYKDDPYYIANNRWRIKPKHAETMEEIKERLRGCINFYVLYYYDNIKRNATTILFHGLPSCFNWYSGGIGLQNEDKLDYKWINCFYNKEEAMQAYRLASDLIGKKYQWNKDENNWVKQTAPVLKQMYDSLK